MNHQHDSKPDLIMLFYFVETIKSAHGTLFIVNIFFDIV